MSEQEIKVPVYQIQNHRREVIATFFSSKEAEEYKNFRNNISKSGDKDALIRELVGALKEIYDLPNGDEFLAAGLANDALKSAKKMGYL